MAGPVGGMIDRMQEEMKARGEISDYDETIGDKIKAVFAKPTSFEEALEAERTEFRDLLHHALTIARIKHMLEHGKPLRN
jgi:class 3 adenylate cyclase